MRLSGKRMFQAEGVGSSKDSEVGLCQVGVCQACCTSCSCKVARIAERNEWLPGLGIGEIMQGQNVRTLIFTLSKDGSHYGSNLKQQSNMIRFIF